MSLGAGKAMLADASKKLSVAWSLARTQWDDGNARSFSSRYIEPLEPKVRSTLLAMEELAEAVGSAKRDCG